MFYSNDSLFLCGGHKGANMFYKSQAGVAVAIALFSTSFSSYSLESGQEVNDLERIVVTANRFEQSIENTLATVNVITRQDIENSNSRDFPALLQSLGGVDVIRKGGQGQQASLFIRGAASAHSLILIDGVRVGSASLGYKAISTIPLNSIERIEVVKGSRAAWYGSDALAGVINITTRSGGASSVAIQAGSDEYKNVQTSLVLSGEKYDISFNAGYEKTHGYDVTTTINKDDDGYENKNIGLNVRYNAGEFGELKFIAQNSIGEVEYDSSGDDLQEFKKHHVLVGWNKVNGSLSHNAQISVGKDKEHTTKEQPTEGHKPSNYQTNRKEANYQLAYEYDQSFSLSAGFDWNDEDVSDSINAWASEDQPASGFTDESRHNLGTYLGGYYDHEDIIVNAVIRRDDNSDFDINNTYNLSIGVPVAGFGVFRLSQGSGFKAPSFNDASSIWGTNPDLKPEESVNREIGFALNLDNAHVDIAVFKNDIKNLIDWGNYIPENIANAEFEGLEINSEFSLLGLTNHLNFTYLKAQDGNTHEQLVLRPKQSINWVLSKQLDTFYLGAEMQYRSDRVSLYKTPISSYTLFNINANYQVLENLKLHARIDNLLDKNYYNGVAATDWTTGEVISDYLGAERKFYAGINYNF